MTIDVDFASHLSGLAPNSDESNSADKRRRVVYGAGQTWLIKQVPWGPEHVAARTRLRTHFTLTLGLQAGGVVVPVSLKAQEQGLELTQPWSPGKDFETLMLERSEMPAGQTLYLPMAEVLEVASRLANTLSALGEQGVAHGSLSAVHVVYDDRTSAVGLLNFGQARFLRGSANSADESAPDHRDDLRALGQLLFWLSTGRRMRLTAQDGASSAAAAWAPESIAHLGEPFIAILLRLLDARGARGYRSAAALVADLQRLCAGQALAALGTPPDLLLPSSRFGRAQEAAALVEAYRAISSESAPAHHGGQLQTGERVIAVVDGLSGIGKTAVIQAACQTMMRHGARVASGKFNQFGDSRPLWALTQALDSVIAATLDEEYSLRHALVERLQETLGDAAGALFEFLPRLEQLMGPQAQPPVLTGEASRMRFALLLRRLVASLASPDKPLVLVLDDLQWADAPSLDALRGLLRETSLRHFLILGAYRTEAVNDSHPLRGLLDQLQSDGQDLRRVTVQAWTLRDVEQLLAAADVQADANSNALASVLLNATAGNPFGVLQAMRVVHLSQALQFDEDLGAWRAQPALAASVLQGTKPLDWVGQQLRRLAPSCQELVCTAAFLGASFDLQSLSAAAHTSVENALTTLWPALCAGKLLLVDESAAPSSTLALRMLHDIVQEAAHALAAPGDGVNRHAAIGRALRDSYTSSDTLESHLFEVVQQFNLAAPETLRDDERAQLQALNTRAASKARASGAAGAALRLYEHACAQLPANAWQSDAQNTFELARDTAEAAYLAAQFDKLDQLLDELDTRQLPVLGAAQVAELRIQGLLARNRLAEALALGQQALQSLNEPLQQLIPPDQWPQVPHESALDLSQPSSPEADAALRLLVWLTPCAFITSFEMYARVILTMVDLARRYPASKLTPISYTNYGLTLCGMGRNDEGFNACELAIALSRRVGDEPLRCKVWTLGFGFLQHWRRAAELSLTPLLQTIEDCLLCGDQEYLGYASFLYCDKAWGLIPLEALQEQHQRHTISVEQFGHDFSWRHCQVWLQYLQSLRGYSSEPLQLRGATFDDSRDLAPMEAAQNSFSLFTAHTLRGWLAWHGGDAPAALQACEQAGRYAMNGTATMLSVDLRLLWALAALRVANESESTAREALLAQAGGLREQLAAWAGFSPVNVAHKLALVDAELARLLGDPLVAWQAYEKAIALSDQTASIHDRGLCAECAGDFFGAQGAAGVQRLVLHRAYRCYLRWGAFAVVRAFLQRHPALMTEDGELRSGEGGELATDVNAKMMRLLDTFGVARASVWLDGAKTVLVAQRCNDEPMLVSRQLADDRGLQALPDALRLPLQAGQSYVQLWPKLLGMPWSPSAWLGQPIPEQLVALALRRGSQLVALVCLEAQQPRLLSSAFAAKALSWHAQSLVDELRNEALVQRMNSSSLQDPQSGLPNRTAFLKDTELAVARARMRNAAGTAVVLIRLRQFADTQIADENRRVRQVLSEIQRRVRQELGADLTLARVDRLKLAVLLESHAAQGVVPHAHALLNRLERPYESDLSLQFDIGICVDPGTGDSSALLNDADAAMQLLALHGPGEVVVFDPIRHRQINDREAMARDLKWAVQNHGLRLVYQPIVNMRDNSLMGAEALVRWRHPVRGEVPAWQLIEVAEATGLIRDVGRWVGDGVVKQTLAWSRQLGSRAVPINFNASPLELMHEDYADHLLLSMQRVGLSRELIAVEVTESTSIQEEQITQRNLRKLEAAGIILCIDDFGMGTSSLSRLHAVLAKRLKIDRYFIEGLATDAGRRTTVQMIIRLAQALNLDIVAEGVNRQAEAAFLLEQRVLKAQGYLYSRPLELAAMNEVMARGTVPPASLQRS